MKEKQLEETAREIFANKETLKNRKVLLVQIDPIHFRNGKSKEEQLATFEELAKYVDARLFIIDSNCRVSLI